MKKRVLRLIVVVAVLLVGAGGYFGYQRFLVPEEAVAAEPSLQTATVSRADIVISVDGTGEIVPAAEVAVGFQSGGLLAEVAVEVGDQVREGDVLARVDDPNAQEAVSQAQMQVAQAEINLDLSKVDAEAGLAQANLEAAQADCEEDASVAAHVGDQTTSARVSLQQAIDGLADAEQAYQEAWDSARDWELYDRRLGPILESERERTASALVQAQQALEVAQASYNLAWVNIDESTVQDAQIKVTEAELALARESLDLQQLELALAQAELDLEAAQRTLEEMVLTAPMDGTVTDVAGTAGERVGTESIITLANLDLPLLKFWVEESDMAGVAVGNTVNVVFEALPDGAFPGEIARVDPALVTVDGTLAVQAWASVDVSSQPVDLLAGMTAEVEVIAGEALDVAVVPVAALRELSAGEYAVFVVGDDGKLELRPVEVGLKDFVNAEIVSGLEFGEQVSLGVDEGAQATGEVPEAELPSGGMPFIR